MTLIAVIALFIMGHELGRSTVAGLSATIGIIAALALVSYLTGATPDDPGV